MLCDTARLRRPDTEESGWAPAPALSGQTDSGTCAPAIGPGRAAAGLTRPARAPSGCRALGRKRTAAGRSAAATGGRSCTSVLHHLSNLLNCTLQRDAALSRLDGGPGSPSASGPCRLTPERSDHYGFRVL